jgi:cytochrome c
MKMIKTVIAAAGVAGLLMGATNASADGAALYTQKLCMTCHGADANTPIQPTYPKLAGQNSAYCQQQVKDIKSGKRNNGMTAAMKPLVAAVSDADIAAICDHIAGL